MRAKPGDHIVMAAARAGEPTWDGRVVAARGPDDGPPYVVEWTDGRTGLLYPGPGAVLRVTGRDDVHLEPLTAHPGDPAHQVREWTVRVTIFESPDDAGARAVLVAEVPEHLAATGTSRRSEDDPLVAGFGDELAVARALHHLADRLVEAAEDGISARAGTEAAHVHLT
jgi:hypothetical protein